MLHCSHLAERGKQKNKKKSFTLQQFRPFSATQAPSPSSETPTAQISAFQSLSCSPARRSACLGVMASDAPAHSVSLSLVGRCSLPLVNHYSLSRSPVAALFPDLRGRDMTKTQQFWVLEILCVGVRETGAREGELRWWS
jgi:hypothetical protein